MPSALAHIESLATKDANFARAIGGMRDLLTAVQEEYVGCAAEKEHYRQIAETPAREVTNVVADGMQNELIAIFNAIYARGMVSCSKKELMQRMADALGCPKIADYSGQLHKIKLTNKYEEIFDDLRSVAITERDKND